MQLFDFYDPNYQPDWNLQCDQADKHINNRADGQLFCPTVLSKHHVDFQEPDSYSLEKDNERLKTENSMLKQTLEDLKSREISYKALLPTAVSNCTRTVRYGMYLDFEKLLYLQG